VIPLSIVYQSKLSADVVGVCRGVAGLAAAVAAQQGGARVVVVLERSDVEER
jgi:NADPH-dependent 2,4-dienoyl-CoA reductase/sulfur reductase-like enzyme